MSHRYILDEHGDPVSCPDLHKWMRWFESGRRHVCETYLSDGSWVSTVFLGLDHNFTGKGPPLLFETMLFQQPDASGFGEGRGEEIDCRRYSTWDEAERGHAEIVAKWEIRLAKSLAEVLDLAANPGKRRL